MASSCADLDATTWYGLSSPEDATLEVTVIPSDMADNALDVAVVLYVGESVDSLVETACVDGQGVQGAEHLEAAIYGGAEYWVQIGAVLSEDAGPGVYTLLIDGIQTIDLRPVPDMILGASPVEISAEASSGLPAALEVEGPCRISGGALVANGAGLCTVTASQSGDADWAPAVPVTTTLRIGRGRQSIALDAIIGVVVGEHVVVHAEAESGLPVTFDTAGSCRMVDAVLHADGSGTCTITASQAGDADWTPAVPVTTTLRIGRGRQSIEFARLPVTAVGAEPLRLSVTSDSGLPVALEIDGPCTLEGRSLRALGAGTCTVTASQDGDADWAPAVPVTTTLRIGRGRQSIEFDAPPDEAVFGDAPLELDPEATSGLPVAVEVEGPCQLLDGDLVSTGAGTCTITASQAGDVDWRPAVPVTTTIAIAPASQVIEFEPIGRRLLGEGSIELEAVSTSGLPLTFSASGPCHADGGVLILLDDGMCIVTASQPGDADWTAAEASASFSIDTPTTGPRQDASSITAATPPGARVGHGAIITSAFEPDGAGEHYYAIALDEADVLEIGGIEPGTTWSVAGPMGLASDEVIWRDMEVDVDTATARWVASGTGIHSIRVADLDPESDLRPAYSISVTIESGIRQVVTQGKLEASMLDRLRPIRCQALREDEEPRPFINGALAGVRCRRPAQGVYEVKLFTFPDQEQLQTFHQTRVDEVHPGLQSVANACARGRRGVRDWEHGRVACWIPTGRSRSVLHWTDERTNTYGTIRTLVGDNRQLLRSWRTLMAQTT